MRSEVARRIAGAALLTAALTACSSSTTSSPASAGAPGAPAVSEGASNSRPTGAPVTTAPTAAVPGSLVGKGGGASVDAAALLAAGYAALQSGYHFTSTVSIGGTVSVVAEGDRIGDSSRLKLTNNGATVSYVITPAGSFTSTGGEAWDQLDTPPASADPISALATPKAVSVTGTDGGTTTLAVVVPAAALGIPTTSDQTLAVVVNGSVLTDIRYATTINGAAADVHAVIGGLVDTSPITAPASITT